MANPEHLAILKQGVAAWIKWRAKNPEVRPDLRGAYLNRVDLSRNFFNWAGFIAVGHSDVNDHEVYFSRTDLREANLCEADLTRADLTEADLRGARLSRARFSNANLKLAYLSEADLRRADLIEADLRGANLRGANLFRADLRKANLTKADLRGTNLTGANLGSAGLTEADLSGANLKEANLSGANLREANLREAELSGANLRGTDLGGADLTGARTGITTFGALDLRRVKGLATVKHRAPSTIGLDTIYRSGGDIPPEFLRGAGVPDEFIAYMRSLVGKAIEYYSCFISYNSQDEEFAKRLHADLQAANVRCWFAPHDMKIGDKIRDRIDESIRIHDKLLLILSHDSIFSDWVEKEVETAFEEERPDRKNRTVLFPIRLDGEVMATNKAWAADIRRTRHIGDFTRWKDHDAYQKGFARLLGDLKASTKT